MASLENPVDEDHEPEVVVNIHCKFCLRCWPCNWLNGPKQWSDHSSGKKHRKAVEMLETKIGHPIEQPVYFCTVEVRAGQGHNHSVVDLSPPEVANR